MNLSDIKKQVIGASYLYHKDRDARLESIPIGDLSFRLVRTSDYYQSSIDNYLVKTPREYFDFSYQDVRDGRVRLLSTFNLSQPNVDLLDIARRADTSMKMIQDYYYPQSQLDEKLSDFLRV